MVTSKRIQQLFTISSCLRHLNLKLEAREEKKIIFQPSTWQTLIEENLPDLIFLRLHLNCIIVHPNTKGYNFEEEFNHAEYWLQRQPHFQVMIEKIQRQLL